MMTDNQIRLQKAKAALDSCRETESLLLKQLAFARESTKRAKERHEDLFMAEEKAEYQRRKFDYRHCTK